MLRSLKLDSQRTSFNEPPYHIPRFPWKSMSHLRDLELVGVLFPAEIPDFPSLETFAVFCSAKPDGLTANWVLNFLRHTPIIRKIQLKHLTSENSGVPLPSQRLSLPTLRSLEFHGQNVSTVRLFDFLDLPLTSMETTISIPRAFSSDSRDLIPLSLLCAGLASSQLDLVALKMVADSASTSLHILPVDENILYPQLKLEIENMPNFFDVCSHIPVSQISELTIQHCVPGNDMVPSWSRTVASLSCLQVLNFSGCYLPLIHGIVQGILPENVILARLSFEEIAWFKSKEPSTWLEPETTETFAALRRMCDRRRALGHPIERLIFQRCRITELIDFIKSFVEVEWDGLGTEMWEQKTRGDIRMGVWRFQSNVGYGRR
ncbi:hypothetical protein ONZ45_g6619 [Pleurotus djamor]|nr:hypothetical protein ONZ45_g6619 [Pleurotus djamor]